MERNHTYVNFNRHKQQSKRESIRCGGILFTKYGEHIVIVQNKYLFDEKKKILWGLPKGHLQNNETYAECAKREIFEETGLPVQITEKHPKLKINNTYYFPIQLSLTFSQLKEKVFINDKVEIQNISVLPIVELCKKPTILNYELRKCIEAYIPRAKKIARQINKQNENKSKYKH